MARIRSIKPSIWGDERFAGLSRDARLLALGLISNADDAGRFIASPTAIAGAVFPHDELSPATIRKWRDEIARRGLIQLYKIGGLDYGWFPNWKKHQVINRPSPSVLPAPPGYGGDPGPHEPPPDGLDSVSDSWSRSLNGQGAAHGVLTTGKGERRKERESPQPPGKPGGSSCAKHPDEPGQNCRGCGTNTRAVQKAANLVVVPDWCGDCDPGTRLVEVNGGDAMARCPRCHPSVVRSA